MDFFISLVVFTLVSAFMIGIGISNLRSKVPVSFYSGEKSPKGITDVKAWNKKHGMMWILYGVIILLAYVGVFLVGDSPLALIPCFSGLILPVIFMIMYHNKLVKQYKK